MKLTKRISLLTLLWLGAVAAAIGQEITVNVIGSGESPPQVINLDQPIELEIGNDSYQAIQIAGPYSRKGYYQVSLRFVDGRTDQEFWLRKRKLLEPEFSDELAWNWKHDNRELRFESQMLNQGESASRSIYTFQSTSSGDAVWLGVPPHNLGNIYEVTPVFDTEEDQGKNKRYLGKTFKAKVISLELRTPSDCLRMKRADSALSLLKSGKFGGSQELLFDAAIYNAPQVVGWTIENGISVNSQDSDGKTVLWMCSTAEVMGEVLKHSPHLDTKVDGRTALQNCLYGNVWPPYALDKVHRAKAELLVNAGASLDFNSAVLLHRNEFASEYLRKHPEKAHIHEGFVPLRLAAVSGNLEFCQFLLANFRVDLDDFEKGNGYPIIKEAVSHPKIVQLLIENGADLNRRITWQGGKTGIWIVGDDATCLHFAARDGVPETIKILIDGGIDLFATARDADNNEVKQTALEVAAFFGMTDNAIAILKHPKFMEADDAVRQAVLDRSLEVGSFSSWLAFESQDRSKLLDALMTHGANFEVTPSGHSAIQIAVLSIHPNDKEDNQSIRRMVSVFREHGASLDVFSAVAIGDIDALSHLLKANPKLSNSYSIEGYPALHMAIKMNYPKAIKLLLDAGCDIEIKNKNGETPLLCVAFWGRDEIAEMLIGEGANVNARAEKQVSPLHEAVRLGNVQIARLLLENGADTQAKDHEGKTPLQWASNEADAKIFARLFAKH